MLWLLFQRGRQAEAGRSDRSFPYEPAGANDLISRASRGVAAGGSVVELTNFLVVKLSG